MQEWKKELCREQPETLQELGKGTYIQRRNITPYERKDGNGEVDKGYSCEYRILTKEEYFVTYLKESTIGPARKYYHITEKGRGYLGALKSDWLDFSKMVDEILKNV